MIDFNFHQGKWDIVSSRNAAFGLRSAQTRLYVNGEWVTLFESIRDGQVRTVAKNDVVLEDKRSDGLSARLHFSFPAGAPGVVVQARLTNRSSRGMTLGTLHLMEVGPEVGLGKPSGPVKVLVDSGGGWWAGVVDIESTSPYQEQWDLLPEEDRARVRQLKGEGTQPGLHNSAGGTSALHNPRSRATLIAGFLTFLRTSANVVWLYGQDQGLIGGWAGCNFAGYTLKPGQTIASEKLFLGLYDDPFTGLAQYADLAARAMKVKLPARPPMGWCSWYAYRLKITQDLVLANARAIKDHFPDYDFSYVQVDHGWQYKDICGHWTETNERFPHGLKWLSGQLKKLGCQLGLWSGFFCVLESSPLFARHPDWLVKGTDGQPLAMPYRWAWEPHDRLFHLDPTHPGAKKFIRDSFTTLRKAGCRYWKIDFTWGIADTGPQAVYHDKSVVRGAETYRAGTGLIRKCTNGDFLYWCSNPINLGWGLSQTSMTACDIGNPGFRAAKQVEGRVEDLDFFRRNATTIISRYYFHKKLYLLNPDVVEVGGAGDDEEAKIRLSLVALAGGQVFLGDDLTALTDAQWKLLGKCVPPYGQAARPVDLFEHTHPRSYPQVWHLPVRTRWGNWEVVGLFNLTEKESKVMVDFASLGLEENSEYLVFEFWSGRLLGRKKNTVQVTLKPVTTQLLLVKRVSDQPMVLATDLHVTQGGVELEKVAFDKKSLTLKGLARRHTGETGRLFVWIPGGFEPVDPDLKKAVKANVLALPLAFDKPAVPWSVRFRRAGRA